MHAAISRLDGFSDTDQSRSIVRFGQYAERSWDKYADCPQRKLFFLLVNSDEFPDILPTAFSVVKTWLAKTAALQDNPNGTVAKVWHPFPYSSRRLEQRLQTIYRSPETFQTNSPWQGLSGTQCADVLTQYAPTALVDGCWLQNMGKTAHDKIPARLFRLYARKLGGGNLALNTRQIYRQLLQQASVQLPEVASRGFAQQAAIMETSFAVPIFQLSLSLFPRALLPEIIGVNLGHYYRISEIFSFITVDNLNHLGLSPRYFEITMDSETIAQNIVSSYLSELRHACGDQIAEQHWQRIWTAFLAQRVVETNCYRSLKRRLCSTHPTTPREQVIRIFKRKLVYARGHHRDTRIGGKRIEEWFAGDKPDLDAFLDAFSASPFIVQNRPEQSLFLVDLLGIDGPMYKVFTTQEIQIIRDWIGSLGSEATECQTDEIPSFSASADRDDPNEGVGNSLRIKLYSSPPTEKIDLGTNKGLFHVLINDELYPEARTTAKKLVYHQLARTRATFKRRRLPPELRLFDYSPDAFEARIASVYQQATNSYQPSSAPPRFTRDEYLWLLYQVSPSPLTDGCWLQHIANTSMVHDEVAIALFSIYADEVGNGIPTHNHSNIYRDILTSEGFEIPDPSSKEFIEQMEIPDVNFEFAVYMLAISQFPKTFLAEIIGLNLAIELSGLGGFYMRLIDEMNYWNLDPKFFSLHLAIDNLASGHAAIAKRVVEQYLDQVMTRNGQAEMQTHWQRIWAGYVSLSIVPKRAWRSLGLRFLLRFGPRRLAAFWR